MPAASLDFGLLLILVLCLHENKRQSSEAWAARYNIAQKAGEFLARRDPSPSVGKAEKMQDVNGAAPAK